MKSTYARIELVGYQEPERGPMLEGDVRQSMGADLTDRQRSALQLAFASGYYARERSVTGDLLVEAMGISRAIVHEHLRVAESKVIAAFLDAQ